MQVYCLQTLEELAPYADDWDRLCGGVPFRSWAWLSTWWRHYGDAGRGADAARRLFVLCVFDHDDTLLGLAPWYLERCASQGRVVRSLGSGEAASDYLGVLCREQAQDQVTDALAGYLSENGPPDDHDRHCWDLLELTGLDAEDPAVGQFARHMARRDNTVCRLPGPNCWRIELPDSWDAYLAMLSKNRRKKFRRLQRRFLATGRAVPCPVEQFGDLPQARDVLIELHQRRRHGLGEPGCFASPRFDAFHREVMPELLRSGQLRLWQLELDGCPAAAEYQVAGGGVIYAYQSGVDPEALDHQPGLLLTMVTLRGAIEGGYRAFDFLRGDEPYKASFRAAPRPGITLRVVPRRTSARLRHGLWTAGSNVKQWIKSGLKLAGSRPAPKHA